MHIASGTREHVVMAIKNTYPGMGIRKLQTALDESLTSDYADVNDRTGFGVRIFATGTNSFRVTTRPLRRN